MLESSCPYWLANESVQANTNLEARDKFSGEVAVGARLLCGDNRWGAMLALVYTAVQPEQFGVLPSSAAPLLIQRRTTARA